MHIYAIGDLHLSFSADKPMDVFGEGWRDHTQRLSAAWRETVQDGDVVLIPGDVSWAMQLVGAAPDLAFIGELPGRKILLRGNHDYWWSAVSRVRAALPAGMYAVQNDTVTLDGVCIGGTRGWACPGGAGFSADDERIYLRELQRLELSLGRMAQGTRRIAMMHFPPFCEHDQGSGFTELLERYEVDTLVYAHLHGAAHKGAFEGCRNGVNYALVSADYLKFIPRQIA